jgi:hypothetical protein
VAANDYKYGIWFFQEYFLKWISYDRRGNAAPVFEQAQSLRRMEVEV